ncbi:MAG: hypothetical protein F4158_04630, partial [Synechococcus sp. SB0675_bin_7]|nr:hypothetical protein [Synechococcus sp. SB0675_bin_7]
MTKIAGVPAKINTKDPLSVTFTFSEAVTGFGTEDVTVTGGAKGAITVTSASQYTLVVTPNGAVNVKITVAENGVTDESGNTGPASAMSVTAEWDAAAPTVAIGVPEKINTNTPFTVTFIFSEYVTGFDATDVTMSGGTAEEFSGSGASYALVVTPDGDVDVVVTVVKDAATDGVNRGPAQDAVSTSVWDETAPTVAIGVPEKINTTVPFKVTFTFSENVTGFDATDVDVSGGTKGTFSGSAKDYTLVVTPTSGKDLTVKVTQDAITDGVNSGPTQAVSKTAEWDADAPTLAISGVTDWINSTADLTVTFTFSESVTDFLTGDVEVNGGTKGMFSGSGASYALVVTPDNGKNVVVTVAKDSATDGANTGPAAAESKTAVWDSTAPVLTITGVNANTNAPFKATFSFDETVTGFAASDIQATNATVSGFTETTAGKAWSTLVTPQSAGAVTIKVAANAAQDAAGNGSAAATASSDYDPDAPTVSSIVRRMPSTTPTNADSLTWRVTFSEAVVNVDANDFAVSGTDATLTATNSDSNVGEVWDVTASGGNLAELDGTVTLGFAEGQDIQDGAGNALDASAPLTNENSYGVDNTVPTVSIDGLPGKINSKAPFTAMFTFSENMVGFDASTADVTVVGGTKGAATGSGKVYKLVVSPEGSKDVTVTVVQDSALDAVGNAGPVADVSAAVEWDSVAPSVESIEFLNPLTSPTRTDSLTWRVTFSEAVLNVSGGDFTVSGDGIGRVTVTVASGDSDAGKVWDVTASRGNLADLDGAVTLGFEADQNIKDSAGNALASVMPTGTNEASYRVDNTAPTVAISGVPGKINSTSDFTATFTFSEDVTGFEKADVNVAGGTAGAFTETSAAVYKLVVSPDNGEDVVVTVKADSATDGANTGPPEDEVATAEWDGSVPTLTITGVPGKINSTSPYTATFTFSEAVTDFDTDDVTVSDAKKGQFTATSATVYKLVVIPEGSKDVTLTVWQDAATDGVNTVPVQDATATAKWDEAAPTVTIGMPEWITSTNDFIVTFTFSEDVTGFDADDVDLLGGTKGTFSTTSAAVYTLVVTPHIDSALVVTVRQDAATDGVNTGPVQDEVVTAGWDADAPTVTIGGMSDWITAADDFTATFTFSETVTGFDASDVDLAGATKGAFSGSGASYALVVTPEGSKDVTATVKQNAAADGAENTGPADAVSRTAQWDSTAPTVTIGDVPASSNSAFTATFIFDETVTGFETTDIQVTNGSASEFTEVTSGEKWTALITPTAAGRVTVSLAAGAAQDLAGNDSGATADANSKYDPNAPTVTIGMPEWITSTNAFTVTFTFSESVTRFDTIDVTVSGGRKSDFTRVGNLTEFMLVVTPNDGEDVTVTVMADAATDAGLNTGPLVDEVATAKWDSTAPTVTISGVPPTSTVAFTATFTFTEAVMGFAAGDIQVTNGGASNFSESEDAPGTVWTAVITPSAKGEVTVSVAQGAAEDAAGNASAAATASSQYDSDAPTVAISGVPEKINSTADFLARFTFSEDVTDFEVGDVEVSRGTAGTFAETSAAVYTLVVTPEGSKDVTVTVKAGSATDGVNTGPVQDEVVTAEWDAVAPELTIDGVPGKINSTVSFTVMFTFSEDVTGFDAADVMVDGGAKGAFKSTNASVYTLVVSPAGDEDVTVTVKAGSATDGVNTGPVADEAATAEWDAVAPTLTISGVPGKINSTSNLTVTFEFSEDVTDFLAADVDVSGGKKGALTGSGKMYTITVTPTNGEDVTVTVTKDAATDGVNTVPAQDAAVTAEWDAVAPELTIGGVPANINSTNDLTVTFTFSEDVSGFDAADIEVSGGMKGKFTSTSKTKYTLLVTPDGDLDVTVTVPAGGITDGLNIGPAQDVSATVKWGETAPAVTSIKRSNTPAGERTRADTLKWRVTFSEAVLNVTAADFTVTAGSASIGQVTVTVASGDSDAGAVWDVTASGGNLANLDDTVTLGFANNHDIEDDAGNKLNTAAPSTEGDNQNSYVVDNTAPTLQIAVPDYSAAAFTATFTFGEQVDGFVLGDITVKNGSASALTEDTSTDANRDRVWTATITPQNAGDVTVEVAQDAVADLAGNAGPAAKVEATSDYDPEAPAVTSIKRSNTPAGERT